MVVLIFMCPFLTYAFCIENQIIYCITR